MLKNIFNFSAILKITLIPVLLVLSAVTSGVSAADSASVKKERIGILGAGDMGGALARHWVNAGYEVMISSRNPAKLETLTKELGKNASAGTALQAARFGNVIVAAVPFSALPQLGKDLESDLRGKVVIDITNPYPYRDGIMAFEAREEGTGLATQRFLPGTKVVRAFNSILAENLESMAHRNDPVAIPVAGNDRDAVATVSRLVRDAGFVPVDAGNLKDSREFDVNTPVYVKVMNETQMREALKLKGQ